MVDVKSIYIPLGNYLTVHNTQDQTSWKSTIMWIANISHYGFVWNLQKMLIIVLPTFQILP